jgi:hypothetical protein
MAEPNDSERCRKHTHVFASGTMGPGDSKTCRCGAVTAILDRNSQRFEVKGPGWAGTIPLEMPT